MKTNRLKTVFALAHSYTKLDSVSITYIVNAILTVLHLQL